MSNIEWTDVTDNIITVDGGGWWCQRISAGCDKCYAEKMNQFRGNKLPYTGAVPKLVLKENLMDRWKKQTKSKKHFVASMTDVFGHWVEKDWTNKILNAMYMADNQIFQVLTKRPEIMRDRCLEWLQSWDLPTMPSNIWVGSTVENKRALHRINALREIPAKIRFLSCEPLLEDLGKLDLQGISWIIAGGESGHGARKCNIDWIKNIVEQCSNQNVAVFVKQLGTHAMQWGDIKGEREEVYLKLKNRKGGDFEEFPSYLKVRQFPDECSTRSLVASSSYFPDTKALQATTG